MTMVPVQSSNVKAIGHDPATEEMRVQFTSGDKIYSYLGVSVARHEALMNAKSKGAHLAQHFRGKS